jgi:hypothetical protein
MFSALTSFLGGSIFRMVWGEISSYMTKRQDHQNEMEMMKLQAENDDKAHQRTLENLRLQAELNVRQVEVQRDAAVASADADAFAEAMKNAFTPTGVQWVDAWNGVIRPAAATIVLVLWFAKLAGQGFDMVEWDMDISGVVLGFYFADRSLGKRGK